MPLSFSFYILQTIKKKRFWFFLLSCPNTLSFIFFTNSARIPSLSFNMAHSNMASQLTAASTTWLTGFILHFFFFLNTCIHLYASTPFFFPNTCILSHAPAPFYLFFQHGAHIIMASPLAAASTTWPTSFIPHFFSFRTPASIYTHLPHFFSFRTPASFHTHLLPPFSFYSIEIRRESPLFHYRVVNKY